MRPADVLLIATSCLIIVLIGLMPLLASVDNRRAIHDECKLFYGPSGRSAVEDCLGKMNAYRGGSVQPEEADQGPVSE
jgi:hypothetical protein